MTTSDEELKPAAVFPGQAFTPLEFLPDYDIQMIHAGLLIPNERAILSMSCEIRKRRGVASPTRT